MDRRYQVTYKDGGRASSNINKGCFSSYGEAIAKVIEACNVIVDTPSNNFSYEYRIQSSEVIEIYATDLWRKRGDKTWLYGMFIIREAEDVIWVQVCDVRSTSPIRREQHANCISYQSDEY